eukprot:TRINITY_DN9356_c0_g1_i2.p1 TRINITY_DN9356_c0_g1~~TRINITY_DN9356_c0_g1_i2.p1  ORF type:complete len:536 (+),score=95.22 TRINITY_DN9356_c0_g1_i2:98-1705(+)
MEEISQDWRSHRLLTEWRYRCGGCPQMLLPPHHFVSLPTEDGQNANYVECPRCKTWNRISVPSQEVQNELKKRKLEHQAFQQRIKVKKDLVVSSRQRNQDTRVPHSVPKSSDLASRHAARWNLLQRFYSSTQRMIFFKSKAFLMKKSYELAASLPGLEVLLIVVNQNNVYTFVSPRLKPVIQLESGQQIVRNLMERSSDSLPALQPHLENPNSLFNLSSAAVCRYRLIPELVESGCAKQIVMNVLKNFREDLNPAWLDMCRLMVPHWTLNDEESIIDFQLEQRMMQNFAKARSILIQKIYEAVKNSDCDILLVVVKGNNIVDNFATPRFQPFFTEGLGKQLIYDTLKETPEPDPFPQGTQLPVPFRFPELQEKHFRLIRNLESKNFCAHSLHLDSAESRRGYRSLLWRERGDLFLRLQRELDVAVLKTDSAFLQVCTNCATHYHPKESLQCCSCDSHLILCNPCMDMVQCTACTRQMCGACDGAICVECGLVRLCMDCTSATGKGLVQCSECQAAMCSNCLLIHMNTHMTPPTPI